MFKFSAAIAIFALAAAASGAAEVVSLKNGRTVEGTITAEDNGSITMQIPGGEVRISRADIAHIDRAEAGPEKPPAPEPQETPVKTPAKAPATEPKTEPPKAAPPATEPLPEDPFLVEGEEAEEIAKLAGTMAGAAVPDAPAAKDAKNALVRKGLKALPALIEVLHNAGATTNGRELAAQAIGELRSEGALKALVEEMLKIVPRGAKVVHGEGERKVVFEIRDAIAAISGQNFRIAPQNRQQDVNLDRIAKWWEDTAPQMSRQVGEPNYSPAQPPPPDMLAAWRKPGATPPKTWPPKTDAGKPDKPATEGGQDKGDKTDKGGAEAPANKDQAQPEKAAP